MTDFHVNLAARRLGAGVIAASDEFFGEKENLLLPERPAFRPHTFGHKGQIVDGWESRRRREPGHDWALIRLGAPGIVRRRWRRIAINGTTPEPPPTSNTGRSPRQTK